MGAGLDDYLRAAVAAGASDLHISAGLPPMVRVDGRLTALDGPGLTGEATEALLGPALTGEQRRRLEAERELDFAYALPDGPRFRGNAYFGRGAVGGAFRVVPEEVPPLAGLGLPPVVGELTRRRRGLVLVTGPTGSGKSTTLAAMLGEINRSTSQRIVTVEDPIEFVHRHGEGVVTQREVGPDTRSFARALRQALRQDPDVILVGEMRDLETISLVLTAAETGHLVLATLHTRGAPQAVDRIVDVFPPHQQGQVRTQLADVLEAVVAQALLPLRAGGRVAACEVLVATPAVRHMIREGKGHQVRSAMQTGRQAGMIPMETSLARLVERGLVSSAEAVQRSDEPEELRRLSGSAGLGA